jgi:hypothetical protein
VSDQFDHLDDSEREWLRASRRSAARRSWLLIGVLVVAAIILAWLTVDGGQGPKRAAAPATTTVDQRAIADGQRALADWGQFAVTNDLGQVKDTFWANGPQYKQLAREAQARKKPIGPPPYTVTMSGVQVLKPRPNQRILRGRVEMTRPGERPQTFHWDVVMQLDQAAGGQWRLWTVRPTAGT